MPTGNTTKMKNDTKDIKALNIRIPKDLWVFLRKAALDQETSMNEIIIRCVEKYRKKIENKVDIK